MKKKKKNLKRKNNNNSSNNNNNRKQPVLECYCPVSHRGSPQYKADDGNKKSGILLTLRLWSKRQFAPLEKVGDRAISFGYGSSTGSHAHVCVMVVVMLFFVDANLFKNILEWTPRDLDTVEGQNLSDL